MRKTTGSVMWILSNSGILGTRSWIFVILTVSLMLSSSSLAVASFVTFGDFEKFVGPFMFVIGALLVAANGLIVFRDRRVIFKMLKQMDANLYSYPDENLIEVRYPWYLEENTIVRVMYAVFGCEVAFLSLIVIPTLAELLIRGNVSNFIYPGWIPFPDRLEWRIFTVVFQLVQVILALWSNYGVIVTAMFPVFEFMRQYKRLKMAICSIKRRTHMRMGDLPKRRDVEVIRSKVYWETFHVVMRANIVCCIQHHQMLFKNFELFKIFFCELFSAELSTIAIVFLFALFSMAKAPSFGAIVNNMGVGCILGTNILMKCLIGEIFSDLNQEVANVIFYDIDWREINGENRQLLLMFHRCICRPLSLYGFSVIRVDRITFSKIIHTSYSAFNIFNASL